jgi:hypothetical protein
MRALPQAGQAPQPEGPPEFLVGLELTEQVDLEPLPDGLRDVLRVHDRRVLLASSVVMWLQPRDRPYFQTQRPGPGPWREALEFLASRGACLASCRLEETTRPSLGQDVLTTARELLGAPGQVS